MQACRELSRLPKAKKLKSINFKRTTPGSIAPIIVFHTNVADEYAGPVDPDHPAVGFPRKALNSKLPHVYEKGFSLHVLPKALLHKVRIPWPNPPFRPAPTRGPDSPRVNMSVLKVMGKNVTKSPVIKNKVTLKMQNAISLIVTRGADVKRDANGKECIVFDDDDAGHHWVLSDWSYIIRPTLEIYRMPYHELIPSMRNALLSVKHYAQALDSRKWQVRDDQGPHDAKKPYIRPLKQRKR